MREFKAIGIAPEGAVQALLAGGTYHGMSSSWRIWDVHLEDIGPPSVGLFSQQISLMRDRVITAFLTLLRHRPSADRSVSLRLNETRTLFKYFRENPWFLKLAGVGLGATFSFRTFGIDHAGSITEIDKPNYIHNYFMFLLYKLGIVGFSSA